ncbi:hypothetical protein HU200_024238 [Digitaria exilis]|uniref:Uncharacterized protein n=1 Tax=Digitaria exilis TaxID=1010633 RepID=A0A835CA56_9POAL|nr:hypothetical protein HU200_024238 [Digitaria exilis]
MKTAQLPNQKIANTRLALPCRQFVIISRDPVSHPLGLHLYERPRDAASATDASIPEHETHAAARAGIPALAADIARRQTPRSRRRALYGHGRSGSRQLPRLHKHHHRCHRNGVALYGLTGLKGSGEMEVLQRLLKFISDIC